MITTCMYEHEKDVPTGDSELDSLLCEIRNKTGDNWQIITRKSVQKRWFRKNIDSFNYEILKEVGGCATYQIIMSASGSSDKAKAYIIGYLSGLDRAWKMCYMKAKEAS